MLDLPTRSLLIFASLPSGRRKCVYPDRVKDRVSDASFAFNFLRYPLSMSDNDSKFRLHARRPIASGICFDLVTIPLFSKV